MVLYIGVLSIKNEVAMVIFVIIAIVCFIIATKLKKEQGGWFTASNQNNDTINTNKHHNRQLSSLRKYNAIQKSTSLTDNLNYDLYQFCFKNPTTNRICKRTVEVMVVDNPVDVISQMGYEDITSLEKIDFPRPSERQEEYYYKLAKTNLPQNASTKDASALISRYEIDDDFGEKDMHSPNPDLVEYATQHKIKLSYYIGKKNLYRLIFNSLDIEEKIVFYIFCVYKDRMNKKGVKLCGNPLKCNHYDFFKKFAQEQLTNSSYVKSISRHSGVALRYFGEFTLPDGSVIYGCRINTTAYKTTLSFLKENHII